MSTILIVENDVNTRNGLQLLLSEEGYNVESAEDGASALNKIDSGIIDLLLSDLRLPDASGLEIHAKIKKELPEVITIIMSAYSTPENHHIAKDLGVFSWLMKPLNIEMLLSNLKEAFERQ